MSSRILSRDKETGLTEIAHYDPVTDNMVIETRQDVQAALDYAQRLRNENEYTRKGMKEEWLHYAHLTDSMILKLRVEHGLNIFNKDHLKACYRKINELYPKLKTTEMVHNPKG